MKPSGVTVERIDSALAILATVIRSHPRGRAALPIFERLERERASLASIDDRLDAALARARPTRQAA